MGNATVPLYSSSSGSKTGETLVLGEFSTLYGAG